MACYKPAEITKAVKIFSQDNGLQAEIRCRDVVITKWDRYPLSWRPMQLICIAVKIELQSGEENFRPKTILSGHFKPPNNEELGNSHNLSPGFVRTVK